jgi:ATP-dependent Clp protease protease subunit
MKHGRMIVASRVARRLCAVAPRRDGSKTRNDEDECDCMDEKRSSVLYREKERHIYIEGSLETEMVFKIKTLMIDLANGENGRKPVHVFICSHGGVLDVALAVHDLLAGASFPVYTYCAGGCCSGAVIVFLAGVKRFMYPNSYLMFHETTYSNYGQDIFQERDARMIYEQMRRYNERIVDLITSRSVLEKDNVARMFHREYLMFPEEAVAAGLATKIFQKKSRKKSS